MDVLKMYCPKCSARSERKHCNSPQCHWRICSLCSPSLFALLFLQKVTTFCKRGRDGELLRV